MMIMIIIDPLTMITYLILMMITFTMPFSGTSLHT